MNDHELDKTFIERSPASLIPPNFANDGNRPGSRPFVGQTRLGFSLLTEVIGEGGMATVYKAWNERLEVFRAIKLLSQEAFSARFETEAKIIAKLHHEGIVEVYNIGEWNGLSYMEMEYVDGSDLQKTLAERGKLPEVVCVAIATLVAEALAHAHTKTFTLVGKQYCGIIHRDLKPANIMISNNGVVKLTDFGIARPAEASLHTIEGNIAGTMHYLSPEQMDGGEVDNRSDIYSFGTILYEMITGVKTFPQGSITELMKQKYANKFKSLSEYGIPINAGLVKIIHRCLKFTPAKRYQSTQDLVNDLQKLNESLTKLTPKELLKGYFSGTEDVTHTDSGKTKTRWFLGKSKTAEIDDKSKKVELSVEEELSGTADEPETIEPVEEPKAVEMLDKPKPVEPTEMVDEPKVTVSAEELKTVEMLDELKIVKPTKMVDKPKVTEPAEEPKTVEMVDKKKAVEPKITETVGEPKAVEPIEEPKTARISTILPILTKSKRMTLVVLLLIFIVLSLSYIAVNTITAKKSSMEIITPTLETESDTGAMALVNATATLDSVTMAVTKPISGSSATSVQKTEPDTRTTPPQASPTSTARTAPARPAATPDPVPTQTSNAKSEIEYLFDALNAGNAGQWDKAIAILEQDNIYNEMNLHRTLHLLNAYVESRRFDKAQAVMNTAVLLRQDAYFLLCVGKFWYYQGSHDKALGYFESSLTRTSILQTGNVLPYTALFLIAVIKHERFRATPSAFNRSSALEAWRKVSAAFASKPDDPRAKRAEQEISTLSAEH